MLGWGVDCGGVRTSEMHINILELKAAFLVIKCFPKRKW